MMGIRSHRLEREHLLITLIFLLTACPQQQRREADIPRELIPQLQSSCLASTCHSSSPLLEYPPQSGLHAGHINALSRGPSNTVCNDCHWDYIDNPLHRNGFINGHDAATGRERQGTIVLFGGTDWRTGELVRAEFYPQTRQCSNVSCHGVAAGITVNWYTPDCNDCHGAVDAINPLLTNGSGAGGKHQAHVARSGFECEECHYQYGLQSTHLDGNYGAAVVPSVRIVFFSPESQAGSGAGFTDQTDTTGEFLCTVECHPGITDADWYRNTTPVWNCYGCHTIHIPKPDIRPVLGSRGDYAANASRISHHIAGGSDPVDDQCLVCHDQSEHKQGTVRVRNADTDATIAYNPANPSSLEPFCLSCHDSNGAAVTYASGGSDDNPFNDGVTMGSPPYPFALDIAGAWAKSYGHGTNQNHAPDRRLTCLGTGEPGSGCHGLSDANNAHGAVNQILAARQFTYNNPKVFNESDFDLCFHCHANYPAVSKEVIFGVKQGGLADADYGPKGPNGKYPPYYIPNTLSHFADHNSATDPDGLSDQGDISDWWSLPGSVNLHWFHISSQGSYYRGQKSPEVGSGINCVNCHNVHGVNTAFGSIHDEWNFINVTTVNGNSYGQLDYTYQASGNMMNKPGYCNFDCHSFNMAYGNTHIWFDPLPE